MQQALSSRISIFLSVDAASVLKYYNPHDPAPLYSRQLSHEFQEYLSNAIAYARRSSSIQYKVFCGKKTDKKFVNPLMNSVRRHFAVKKSVREMEFGKFKKRNYILLGISFCVVIIFQGIVPGIFGEDHRIHSVFSNAIDVFSWVILWKPIERLIFYWNPFKKDILLLEKMEKAGVIIIENEKELDADIKHSDAA